MTFSPPVLVQTSLWSCPLLPFLPSAYIYPIQVFSHSDSVPPPISQILPVSCTLLWWRKFLFCSHFLVGLLHSLLLLDPKEKAPFPALCLSELECDFSNPLLKQLLPDLFSQCNSPSAHGVLHSCSITHCSSSPLAYNFLQGPSPPFTTCIPLWNAYLSEKSLSTATGFWVIISYLWFSLHPGIKVPCPFSISFFLVCFKITMSLFFFLYRPICDSGITGCELHSGKAIQASWEQVLDWFMRASRITHVCTWAKGGSEAQWFVFSLLSTKASWLLS